MSDKRRQAVIDAAEARSDLNIFAAVQALMEHSLLTSKRFRAEATIVRICRREQQRCLHDYDRAIARATAPRGKEPGK